MKKLRLELEAVVVESFPTVASRTEMLGTVEARGAGESLDGPQECTVDGCSGDGACSWHLACSRDDCSGYCTGYPGCSNDENCSELPGCTGIGVCYWTP